MHSEVCTVECLYAIVCCLGQACPLYILSWRDTDVPMNITLNCGKLGKVGKALKPMPL